VIRKENSPDFRERGERENHKNGEEMTQTLMKTLVDGYLFHV